MIAAITPPMITISSVEPTSELSSSTRGVGVICMKSPALVELPGAGGFVEKAMTAQDNARKTASTKMNAGRIIFFIRRL